MSRRCCGFITSSQNPRNFMMVDGFYMGAALKKSFFAAVCDPFVWGADFLICGNISRKGLLHREATS